MTVVTSHLRYLDWLGSEVSKLHPERKAEIWADAQAITKPALRRRCKEIDHIVLDTVVREKQRRRTKNAPTTGRSQNPEQDKELDFWDGYYFLHMKRLHATIPNVGFGEGKRQFPVFNSSELTFKRNGNMTGIAANVLELAIPYRANADSETDHLIDWLVATIDETREHRRARRAHFYRKAAQKAQP